MPTSAQLLRSCTFLLNILVTELFESYIKNEAHMVIFTKARSKGNMNHHQSCISGVVQVATAPP